MTKGVVLFAFDSTKFNYYSMAVYAARRINHFLALPVTLVTDKQSLPKIQSYTFDKLITVVPDKNNSRDWGQWINKGRYQAYELSPYDETILLDVDYIVNSNKLLKTFEFYDDFCCHNRTNFFMNPNAPQEILNTYSHNTLWATVVTFKKTKRAEQIFQCLEMVQKNYNHYANLHSFIQGTYRNDYALTIALDIVNGHSRNARDIIPWNLNHVGMKVSVIKNSEEFNTEYTLMYDNWQKGKIRKEYMTIKDMDLHIINKENYLEIING